MIARHRPVFRRRLARDAFLFGGLAVGIAQGLGISPTIDGLIYWRAHLDALYPPGGWTSGEPAYVYPPPMAQLLAPIHLLGYGIYQTLWTTMLFGCLWYCAGIWSWLFIVLGMIRLAVPGAPDEFSVVLGYAMTGNVQLLLAAAIVASFRNSATWVAPLLTKPTMGIGLLWYPLRREWRALGAAAAVTLAVVAISFVMAPSLWLEWIDFGLRNSSLSSQLPAVPISLPVRLVMSGALLLWAAPRGHRWAVPIAAGWAIPLLYTGSYIAIWIGAIRLSGWADRLPRVQRHPLRLVAHAETTSWRQEKTDARGT